MKNSTLFFEYISKYLNVYCLKQAGKSMHTIKSYRDNLTIFRKFILEVKHMKIKQFHMEDCSKDLILEYVEYLRKGNRSNATINHHVTAIKGYLYYVSDIDVGYQGLALSVSHIPTFRQPKAERECLDDTALKMMFEAPKKTRIGIRNITIMVLLYETAMRVGEIINLKVSNLYLNAKEPYCLVHGKGDKERIVGLSSLAIGHIRNQLDLYHRKGRCEYLFYTTIKGSSNKLSASTIETFLQKYADQVREKYPNIPSRVYPHMFRRTRATHLYQDGIPLELVSRMLGHSHIDTTKIYAKPSIEMLRKAVENESDSKVEPEWDDEDEVARMFGLR